MKLLTFQSEDGPKLGMQMYKGVLDLQDAHQRRFNHKNDMLNSMQSLLDGGEAALDLVDDLAHQGSMHRHELVTDAQLLTPMPRPRSIRDCMVFDTHLLQATRGAADMLYPPAGHVDRFLARLFGRGFLSVPKIFYDFPAYYKGNPGSVVGPNAQVNWPWYSNFFDYELEFGVFIGKGGSNIKAANALDHIAGYCIFNDFSARDMQLREMKQRLGPAKGKDFDTGNAMGPWLVTKEEISDPYNLKMVAEVDGERWTDAFSSGMAFSFEEIIEYISQCETLYPGDFIGAGTVGGGCGLEHGKWLKAGQTITLKVEGLGVLSNTIAKA